ncbi:hypothetical protein RVM25_29255, partial [Enterobacter hormaechei subsp. xiangfangensis]
MLYLEYSTCFNEFYVEQLQLFNERLGFTLNVSLRDGATIFRVYPHLDQPYLARNVKNPHLYGTLWTEITFSSPNIPATNKMVVLMIVLKSFLFFVGAAAAC